MGSSSAEVERLLQAARLHLAKGGLEEAAERASEAIRLDAKEPAAYVLRAEAHRKLKRLDRALADLAVAIRIDPTQPGPYVIRAEILKRRNQFDQAIADATHALTIDPRNAAAFSTRAECRSAIGDKEGADEDVQEMLLIDPTRSVPILRAKFPSEDASPVAASDGERFWKESGRTKSSDTSLFADGKPVDKSYRSRQVIGDDDAPEALGLASGYKPETVPKPIPRMQGRAKTSSGKSGGVAIVILGVAAVSGCALWMAFRGDPEGASSNDPTAVKPSQVARPEPNEPPPVPVRSDAAPVPRTDDVPQVTNSVPSKAEETVTAPHGAEQTDETLASLRGTWLAFAEDAGGRRIVGEEMLKKKKTLKVVDNSYELSTTYYKIVGKIRAIPKDGKNAIDLDGKFIVGGDGKNVLLRGIFEIKDDTLRLCYSYNDDAHVNERPRRFDMADGHLLVTFERTDRRSEPKQGTSSPAGVFAPSIEGTQRREGHTGVVLGLAFSPDGKWLASASGDSTVRLWNVTGDQLDNMHITLGTNSPQPPKAFINVAFSPDGKRLAASNMDGRVFLWDASVTPPKLVRTLEKHDDPVVAIAFSPDSKSLATGGRNNGLVCVWDLSDPSFPIKTSISPEKNGVWSLAFSPDGTTLLEGVSFPKPGQSNPGQFVMPGQIWAWDISQRPFVKKSIVHNSKGAFPRTIVFSPDGSHIAYGDGTAVRVRDLKTDKQVCTFENHTKVVTSVAFTPDGKYLLSGAYDKTARLWDAKTGKQVLEYGDANEAVEPVAISPNGRLLAVAGHDKVIALLRLTSTEDVESRSSITKPTSTPPVKQVVTEVQTIGDRQAVPEIANVTEINTKGKDFCPWLSPDGLTIYWVLEPPGAEGEIWMARRKDVGSLFTGKRQIGYGRHIAVSSDGLTMFMIARRADGRAGDSIQVAKRRSASEEFGRPQEVVELKSIIKPRNLFLSQDGLTLLFNEGDDSTFRLSMARRGSVQSRWEPPKALPISSQAKFDGLMLCPFLTNDGLTLFFNVQNVEGPRFLAMSRKLTDERFENPALVSLPDVKELIGWTPRFVEATNELFFCSTRLLSNGNMDIWVVRNFKAIPMRDGSKRGVSTQGGMLRAKPVVKDLGSFTLTKDGRMWNVTMPQHFTKAEVIFYRGDPSDQTLNAAWEGRLQINGKDVVRFQKGSGRCVFLFHDFTTTTDYAEKNDYKKTTPNRYLDVTNYLHPGENAFFYYHEQRADLPMGVILRITVGQKVDGTYEPNLAAATTIQATRVGDIAQLPEINTKEKEPIVRDLGAFTLTNDGRRWNVKMPQHFTKAEVSFYRGVPSDLTLNAAWKGHLQVNGKDVVRFKKRSEQGMWLFHDFTTAADYKETYQYKKGAPARYIDITKYLRPGDNSIYYYHEQGPDHSFYYYHEEGRNVPMGVMLRITE